MEIKRRGFTLIEIIIVVAIMGIFIIILFNMLSAIRKTTSIVDWRARTNTQLTESFKVLTRDLERANYPSIITNENTYQNPEALGAGKYKQGDPNNENLLRLNTTASGEKIIFDDVKTEDMVLMNWQINTPEVIVTGMEAAPETTICTLSFKKQIGTRRNVIVYKVQAPVSYDYIDYSNYFRLKNNKETILLDNAEYIKFDFIPKYTEDYIDSLNTVLKTGSLIDPDSREYFHEWQNPHVLTVEIGISENKVIRGLFRRKTKYKVNGKFTVDPVSVSIKAGL